MNSFLNRFGVRMGATTLAALLACVSFACSDDGMSEEMGDGDMTTETGGDGDGDGDGDGALSYAADIQPIWDANCTTGCHMAGGLAEFLDLSGDSYGNVVGVLSTQAMTMQLIEANNSGNSYLIAKLRGTQVEAGGSGSAMPSGGASPLPEDTIVMIEEWIDAGALP
jgi:hypothetical protein